MSDVLIVYHRLGLECEVQRRGECFSYREEIPVACDVVWVLQTFAAYLLLTNIT
jgi:hypothetical protein